MASDKLLEESATAGDLTLYDVLDRNTKEDPGTPV
jgi:hypothetical protein